MNKLTKTAYKNTEIASEKTPISLESLAQVAIWLDGYVTGKGDFRPLGTVDLDNLWGCLKYLQGDVRFYLPEKNREPKESS